MLGEGTSHEGALGDSENGTAAAVHEDMLERTRVGCVVRATPSLVGCNAVGGEGTVREGTSGD